VDNGNGKVLLVGWKEVAKFFSCSDRTAMKFPRRGLPVHKMPDGGIYVIVEDALDWIRKQPLSGKSSK